MVFTIDQPKKFLLTFGPLQLNVSRLEIDNPLSLTTLTISDFKSSAVARPIKTFFGCFTKTRFFFYQINRTGRTFVTDIFKL